MKQFTLAAICLLFMAACNSHSDDHNGHSHEPGEPHGAHENHSVPEAPVDTTQETFSLSADSTMQRNIKK